MNKKIGIAVGLISLMVPAGIALADEGGIHLNVGVGASGSAAVQHRDDVELGTNVQGDVETESDNGGIHGSATSTLMRAEKHGKSEDVHGNATSSVHAKNGDNEKENGLGKGGIPAFLRWLFGLSSSTTVGDIRTQMEATTTASTTNNNGLGFFAHLFSFFHIGK